MKMRKSKPDVYLLIMRDRRPDTDPCQGLFNDDNIAVVLLLDLIFL